VLNIAGQGRVPGTFGFGLRQLALTYHLPCFTCPDTLGILLDSLSGADLDYRTLLDYRNQVSSERVLTQ